MVPWPHQSPQPKRHFDRLSRFCTADGTASILQCAVLPPQNCPFSWSIWTLHLINDSWGSVPHLMVLWAIQVLNPNGISIGSAVYARLTTVTDRPTDRQTYKLLNL